MSITPKTLSAIQQAGEAIDKARQELTSAVTNHAQRVMAAIKHDPTHRDNEKALEDWKALTQLAREVETAEKQFRTIYFTAEQMVMQEVQVLPALTSHTTSPKTPPASNPPQIQDVIAKPAIKKAKKSKVAVLTPVATDAPKVNKLSKNDQKVLDHLGAVLQGREWTRLTLQSIAVGAGIPNGSSAAAMKRLLNGKRIEVDARGHYRLV